MKHLVTLITCLGLGTMLIFGAPDKKVDLAENNIRFSLLAGVAPEPSDLEIVSGLFLHQQLKKVFNLKSL